MIALILATMQSALASSIWVGGSSVLNDPLVLRRGPSLGAEYSLTDAFGVQASLAWFPAIHGDYLRPVTEHLIDEMNIAPDLSLTIARSAVQMSWWPLRSTQDQRMSRLGIQSGLGLVYTRDDLETMQASPNDPVYAATANQIHPTLQLGLSGEAYRGPVGVRLSFEGMIYSEQVADLEPHRVRYSMLTLGLVLGQQPPPAGG